MLIRNTFGMHIVPNVSFSSTKNGFFLFQFVFLFFVRSFVCFAYLMVCLCVLFHRCDLNFIVPFEQFDEAKDRMEMVWNLIWNLSTGFIRRKNDNKFIHDAYGI